MAALAAAIAYGNRPAVVENANTVTDAQVMSIVLERCTGCHAASPTQLGFAAAPANIELETIEQLSQYTEQVLKSSVQTTYMPLGNMTGMTAEERAVLGAYLTQ